MTNKKVLYFTAGQTPTEDEQEEIDAAMEHGGYDICVRSASASAVYEGGEGGGVEPADFVMGTVPDAYGEEGSDTPVFDPGNIPTSGLVEEGDTIVLTDGAGTTLDCTLVVTDGVPTLTCAGTAKIIKSGVEFLSPAAGGARTDGYTPTIAAGEVTAIVGS